jgi:hypothetical protein
MVNLTKNFNRNIFSGLSLKYFIGGDETTPGVFHFPFLPIEFLCSCAVYWNLFNTLWGTSGNFFGLGRIRRRRRGVF